MKIIGLSTTRAPQRVRALLLFLALLLSSQSLMAAVKAHLSRSKVTMGDTVDLVITYSGQTKQKPVTQSLSKDFKILGTSSGTKIEFLNGQVTAQTNWTVKLKPKHTGTLQIPSITIKGEKTAPLSLLVSKLKVARAAEGPAVFIETSIEPKSGYVQQMVIYTVRIFHSAKLVEGEMPDPKIDNALVRRLDPDKNYVKKRAGRRYRVIERQYAVFPQESGKLEIPAPVLEAKTLDKSRQTDAFGGLGNDSIFSKDPFFAQTPFGNLLAPTRPIRVKGQSQTIQVKQPVTTAGTDTDFWLPAREVVLAESYDPTSSSVKVGEPITREISLRIDGLTGAQLPQIDVGATSGANVYPDKPKPRTRGNATGVLGDSVQKFAYVPTEAGELVIPPITLSWWDIVNDEAKIAKLPGRTIQILSAAGKVVKPKPKPETLVTSPLVSNAIKTKPVETKPKPALKASETPADPISTKSKSEVTSEENSASTVWQWLALLFALLWLATMLFFWQQRVRSLAAKKTDNDSSMEAGNSAREARKQFEQACKSNNPQKARTYLLQWAQAHWPDNPPSGLTGLSKRLKNKPSRKAVVALDSFLFNGSNKQWNGTELLKSMQKLPLKSTKTPPSTGLPALYDSARKQVTATSGR